MMMFHVPAIVSSFIMCSSESACREKDVVAGFAVWYSCPVCTYRICWNCASVVLADIANRDKFSLENLIVKQFSRFGSLQKEKHPTRELFIEKKKTVYSLMGEAQKSRRFFNE